MLGCKQVFKVAMREGATIKEDKSTKDTVLVEGSDIDEVSQSAADLHNACLPAIRRFDIRKFLDGVYCQEKVRAGEDEGGVGLEMFISTSSDDRAWTDRQYVATFP